MALPFPGMDFVPFDVLTAEEMDQMAANDTALAAGTGLNDGSIAASKLNLGGSTSIVTTNQNTASATFTNLTTTGPSITLNVPSSGMVLVSFGGRLAQSTVNGAAVMGLNISGANTIAPSDDVYNISSTANADSTNYCTKILSGLNTGSTTFTVQYRRQAGSGTAAFQQRHLTVLPIG